MVTRCHPKHALHALRPGSRARRQRGDHLRLPEHPRPRRWFPAGEPPDARRRPDLVRRSRSHPPRGRGPAAPRRPVTTRGRGARPRAGPQRPRQRSARSPTRSSSTGRRATRRSRPSTGRCMPGRSSSSPRHRTACNVDHRHVGDPIDDALARLSEAAGDGADGRPSRADPDLRQRHVPTGSSTTPHAPVAAAGATWRRAATAPRRPATAPRSRSRPEAADPAVGCTASRPMRSGRRSLDRR